MRQGDPGAGDVGIMRGYPKQLLLDNGPEFNSKTFADWAEARQVKLAFIQPGKPAQNAYIERFNRTFREDVLDAYLFHSIHEVQRFTNDWLEEYNAIRPHQALSDVPPYQFTADLS
jgi:putative transposase